jgi:hypothetical protein
VRAADNRKRGGSTTLADPAVIAEIWPRAIAQ